nr:Uncharacterised protein [Raoultella sp. NCTC 9187]
MAKSSLKAYPFTLLKSVLIVSLLSLIVSVFCLTGLFNYQSHQVDEVVNKQLLLGKSELIQHKLEDFSTIPSRSVIYYCSICRASKTARRIPSLFQRWSI